MSDLKAYHPFVSTIVALLEREQCAFTTFEHEPVRTSEEAAAVRPEYSISQGAKALIVRAKMRGAHTDVAEGGKEFVQIVVPGDARFDVKKAKEAIGARDIRFALPEEVATITDGILPGGVPPFGNLFGLRVFADESLLVHDEIIFNAGDRRFSIALKTADYIRVVSPTIVNIVA